MKTMSPVVHFEMPAEDKTRVKRFYENAFGWIMTQLGQDMGSYLLATTSPVDENNMHKEKGAINGGFYQKGEYGTVPHIVIAVDDLSHSMEKVRQSGGEVIGDPTSISGIGDFVMIKDTEGNRVGMLQPLPMEER
ncbi:MAG: VOC family protein [Prolixibacteraceae bacterium]|nr:VOC family protein [Prolixibacteraceae bacterium]